MTFQCEKSRLCSIVVGTRSSLFVITGLVPPSCPSVHYMVLAANVRREVGLRRKHLNV